MTIRQDQSKPKNPELEIKLRELEIQKEIAKANIDFAKFGFRGTLIAGLVGMALILILPCLRLFTDFKISGSELCLIALMIAIPVVVFGYLSLQKIPNITAVINGSNVSVNAAENRTSNKQLENE